VFLTLTSDDLDLDPFPTRRSSDLGAGPRTVGIPRRPVAERSHVRSPAAARAWNAAGLESRGEPPTDARATPRARHRGAQAAHDPWRWLAARDCVVCEWPNGPLAAAGGPILDVN